MMISVYKITRKQIARPKNMELNQLMHVHDLLLSLDDGKIYLLASLEHYRSSHSPSQIAALFRPFLYSPWLVFIISFWSNPFGLCSLTYICASISIRSTRIGFGSDSFRSIHYPSLLSSNVIRSSIIHTLMTPNSRTLLLRIAFRTSLTLCGSASTI